MIVNHQGLLLRINSEKNCVEYSKNNGQSWNKQGGLLSNCGQLIDLADNGTELLATSTKGLYYSKNKGQSFNKK